MAGTAGEITALLNLIEDPDETVYQTVKSRIIEIGCDIIPALEEIVDDQESQLQTDRANELIDAILVHNLKSALSEWLNSDEKSIVEIAYEIHRFLEPDSKKDVFLFEIERIRKSIWLELNNYLTPLEEINVFNKVLFDHFKINTGNLDYSLINQFDLGKLLTNKKSNTYPISALYLILGDMLGVPLEPVDVPNQNLVGYIDVSEDDAEIGQSKILFFIDPVTGQVYSHKDINSYINKIYTQKENIALDLNNRKIYTKNWLIDLAKSAKKNALDLKYSGIMEIIKELYGPDQL